MTTMAYPFPMTPETPRDRIKLILITWLLGLGVGVVFAAIHYFRVFDNILWKSDLLRDLEWVNLLPFAVLAFGLLGTLVLHLSSAGRVALTLARMELLNRICHVTQLGLLIAYFADVIKRPWIFGLTEPAFLLPFTGFCVSLSWLHFRMRRQTLLETKAS